MERPDLSQVPPDILAYILYLEEQLNNSEKSEANILRADDSTIEIRETPNPYNIITLSKNGIIKRTPRYYYGRQRRGGMGVFDIDLPDGDANAYLVSCDEKDTLVILSDFGRLYHLPVSQLEAMPVRARGISLSDKIKLAAGEQVRYCGPLRENMYLAMLSQRGYVRILRYNYLGTNVRPGTQMLDVGRYGPLVTAAWVDANDDVLIITEKGLGIRFSAKAVHPAGSLGIRLEKDDTPIAITGVNEATGVFLLAEDGKGTIRLMSGFRSNKSPGAGGKVAIKADKVISAFSVEQNEDIFIISSLSKLIRFSAGEIPAKEGVVQGVNCMALRADKCIAAAKSPVLDEISQEAD